MSKKRPRETKNLQLNTNISNVLHSMPYLFVDWLTLGNLSSLIFVSKNIKFQYELSLVSRKCWLLKTLLQITPNKRTDAAVKLFYDESCLEYSNAMLMMLNIVRRFPNVRHIKYFRVFSTPSLSSTNYIHQIESQCNNILKGILSLRIVLRHDYAQVFILPTNLVSLHIHSLFNLERTNCAMMSNLRELKLCSVSAVSIRRLRESCPFLLRFTAKLCEPDVQFDAGAFPDCLLFLTLNNYQGTFSKEMFPSNLRELRLYNWQSKKQNGILYSSFLPSSLLHATFQNVSVTSSLESEKCTLTLQSLTMSNCIFPMYQAIDSKNPIRNVTKMVFLKNCAPEFVEIFLPSHLQHLDMTTSDYVGKVKSVPNSITTLKLKSSNLVYLHRMVVSRLPPRLKKLVVADYHACVEPTLVIPTLSQLKVVLSTIQDPRLLARAFPNLKKLRMRGICPIVTHFGSCFQKLESLNVKDLDSSCKNLQYLELAPILRKLYHSGYVHHAVFLENLPSTLQKLRVHKLIWKNSEARKSWAHKMISSEMVPGTQDNVLLLRFG